MAYADLATIQATDPGDVLTAAWCDQARDNDEFFIDPPVCSVFHNAAVSVPDATGTILNANSETFDNDSMHSTVSQTSRITIQTPGRYLFLATLLYAPDADGVRAVGFRIDGSTVLNSTQVVHTSAGSSCVITGSRAIPLAAGQFVECRAFHTAGGALNCTLEEFVAIFLTR